MGVLPAFLLLLTLQSCFTGIESTPKITYKDVKKQVSTTPEQEFDRNFRVDSFSTWLPGRSFLVTDDRGGLTYLPPAGKIGNLVKGDTIVFRGYRTLPSIFGDEVTELVFVKANEPLDTFLYRGGASADELKQRGPLKLPFMVDLSLVKKAREILQGKELYTRTNRWYSGQDTELKGRKFLRVKILDVISGNEIYPFRILFRSAEGGAEEGAMLMAPSEPDGVPSLRGFENLFVMSDPRQNYPHISDSHWELIRNGNVEIGMTTQEVQLSLGSPSELEKRPDQSILYERWSYPGGIYLIFEDGLLTRTNL